MSSEVPNLPRDVMFDILSRVPIKSLLQFRCVAKSWPPLIAHPHFIKLHLARSTSDPTQGCHFLLYYESSDYTKDSYSLRCINTFDEHMNLEFPFKSVHGYIRIVGSSRGLICLFDTNYFTYIGRIILWNPVIRKSKFIPNSHLSHRFRDSFSHMVVGFGFVSKIDDYKVVQILYDSDRLAIPDVLVYTMKSNFWRKVGAVAPCYIPKCWTNNVYVNGTVHWMAYKRPKEDGVCDSIMSFDMSDEVFWEMGMPNNLSLNYNKVHLAVSDSGESLALILYFESGLGDWWEIWFMNEYGVVESWTKQFIIEQAQISFPLCFLNNGELLFVLYNGKLVFYDPGDQQVKDLEIYGLPGSFRVVSYMTSLVLLDGGNEVLE
ncbi:F-box protein At3g07870-like [Cornus florida]|uniref:F-box protein At3g07870-like n=1 Tax=Cornus florida TaxID=4283 RepID=UPI0028A14E63|nr:F-box protein At3g07870-like [Cornus florida]